MTKEEWVALGTSTHGLTPDLAVPIAAVSVEAIESYVGKIVDSVPDSQRSAHAVVVEADRPARNDQLPLWSEEQADWYYDRLHPERQLWVHVDYTGYRQAWKRFGFGTLDSETFLDHIQNREAVRLGGYSHPFLRLCPVSRETNTSGGLDNGAEGMEKQHLQGLDQQPEVIQASVRKALKKPIVLADPVDLTKMLDIPPGLTELQGVASIIKKFYVNW